MARKFLYFVACCVRDRVRGACWRSPVAGRAQPHGRCQPPTGHFTGPAGARRQRLRRSGHVVFPRLARPTIRRAGSRREAPPPGGRDVPPFAVFFVHPTSYLDRGRWNAALATASRGAGAAIRSRARQRIRPGERSLGAALSPGGLRRLPHRLARAQPRSTRLSRRRASLRRIRSPVSAPTCRSCSPDTARARLLIDELLRERIDGTPLKARIAMVYRSAGRFPSRTTFRRSACPRARRRPGRLHRDLVELRRAGRPRHAARALPALAGA